MDNYEISRDRAQAYFLGFDQNEIICNWKLDFDEAFLNVDFLGRKYQICRKTGEVLRVGEMEKAGFSEVLSIFDFLCHAGKEKFPAGKLAPVNSLKGSPKTGGVTTDFYTRAACFFDRDTESFRAACLELGAREVNMGDMGFAFPLFSDLVVTVKFYRSDEEFPASITLLWDENLLQYVHYETVFYIAGYLLEEIQHKMQSYKDQPPLQ